MKRIQCTGCGQVFWTELQLDESLISAGEWVQNPCPRCGVLWAIVEPPMVITSKRGRRGKPGPKPKGRPRRAVQAEGGRDGTPEFSAAGIRRLRKKLKVSQKQFASLAGVSTGTVVGWESGKFKPRGTKVAELSNIAKWDRDDLGTKLAEKETKLADAASRKTPAKKKGPKSKRRRRQVLEKLSEVPLEQMAGEPEEMEEAKSQEWGQVEKPEEPMMKTRQASHGKKIARKGKRKKQS